MFLQQKQNKTKGKPGFKIMSFVHLNKPFKRQPLYCWPFVTSFGNLATLSLDLVTFETPFGTNIYR